MRGRDMSQIEKLVEEFISDLQWDLRASYNSSSCLNKKQREFLKEKLEILLSDFSNTLDLLKQQPSQQDADQAMVEGFEQQPTAVKFTKELRNLAECALYDLVPDDKKLLYEACDIIDSAESINADLLVASERGLSYINAIVCKVPRPITELKEDKEFVEAAIEKAKKEG